jgi:hypothetical protein
MPNRQHISGTVHGQKQMWLAPSQVKPPCRCVIVTLIRSSIVTTVASTISLEVAIPVDSDRSTASDNGSTFATRLANEAYVLAYGVKDIPDGFKQAVSDAITHPLQTLEKLGLSTAVGFGVGLLATRIGPMGSVVRGIGIASAVSLGADVAKPLAEAMDAGWHARSQHDIDAATSQLGNSLGAFAFDTLIQTPFASIAGFGATKLSGRMLRTIPTLPSGEDVTGTIGRFTDSSRVTPLSQDVRLNFKVDPEYLAWHTLINTQPDRFVGRTLDASMVAFQNRAWQMDRDSYQFFQNCRPFVPGEKAIPESAAWGRRYLSSLAEEPGIPGRAHKFLRNASSKDLWTNKFVNV